MKMRMAPERLERIYALIAERALEGAPAPSYADLAAAAGLKDAGGAIRAGLAALEAAGRITIERRNRVSLRYRVNGLGCWTGFGGRGASAKEARRRQRTDYSAPRAPVAPRACLCCRALFESEGKHNRLCARCRTETTAASPLALTGHRVLA
jgi:hypothetical protein